MRFAWLGAAALTAAAPAVLAQQQSIDVAESAARGLEAQYAATLIRERRLADEREQTLLNEAQARLVRARADADRQMAGAQTALEAARAEFSRLSAEYAMRDAVTRAELETYRAEARGLVAEATPERLAALQRFADGDRVGAWSVLEQLRVAEDRAIESSANARRAVRWREDARLRMIMRDNGEATTEDVLRMWQEAARLDPRDFMTLLNLARAQRQVGQVLAALDTLDEAIDLIEELSLSPFYATMVAREMTAVGASDATLRSPLSREVETARAVLANNPDSVSAQLDLANALLNATDPTTETRAEAEALARRAFAAAPDDPDAQTTLAWVLMNQALLSRGEAAMRQMREAAEVGRIDAVTAQSPATARYNAAHLQKAYGDILAAQGGQTAPAIERYRRAEALARSIWTQDPSLDNLVFHAEMVSVLGRSLEPQSHAEAVRFYADALSAFEALSDEQLATPLARRRYGELLNANARVAIFYGGDAEAAAEDLEIAAQVIATVRQFHNEAPGNARESRVLGEIFYNQFALAQRVGDLPRALQQARLALQENPQSSLFKLGVAAALINSADMATDANVSRGFYQDALAVLQSIPAADAVTLRRNLALDIARTHGELGRLSINVGDVAAAEPLLRHAVNGYETALADAPAESRQMLVLGRNVFLTHHAAALWVGGEHDEARARFERLLTLLPPAPRQGVLSVQDRNTSMRIGAHIGLGCIGEQREQHFETVRDQMARVDDPQALELTAFLFHERFGANGPSLQEFQAWCG